MSGGPRKARRKSGGRPRLAGGGGGSGAARSGLAGRRGLKHDALWKWRERSHGGREGGEGAPRGRRASARGGAQSPERGCGPLRPSAPAAGAPGGGGGRHPGTRSPPSTRLHLPSLAFLFPSALRAQRKGVLLPFPWGALPCRLPGCRSRRPGPARRRGFRRMSGPGRPGSFSGSCWVFASALQRRPPSPREKYWLLLTAEPVKLASARKGVSLRP